VPILDIEIVVRPNEALDRNLASDLADRTGEIFGSPPGHTWVKVRTIAKADYAENSESTLEDVYPVFASVLKAELPDPDALAGEVAGLTTAISQVCRRPEGNVHILYLPAGAGRVAFGGRITPT
jgi:phenylpyruvate tautomerase PptA (4-oxalocrotonate tautomerase family)